jgi:hypothetical protein
MTYFYGTDYEVWQLNNRIDSACVCSCYFIEDFFSNNSRFDVIYVMVSAMPGKITWSRFPNIICNAFGTDNQK